mmetsp:Transcript_13561/g.15717  ORF Transcript_13561/g.15717 Transcript_13561/m.15717 type:complete len:152 (+) Transcript_13561:385-840(+)
MVNYLKHQKEFLKTKYIENKKKRRMEINQEKNQGKGKDNYLKFEIKQILKKIKNPDQTLLTSQTKTSLKSELDTILQSFPPTPTPKITPPPPLLSTSPTLLSLLNLSLLQNFLFPSSPHPVLTLFAGFSAAYKPSPAISVLTFHMPSPDPC